LATHVTQSGQSSHSQDTNTKTRHFTTAAGFQMCDRILLQSSHPAALCLRGALFSLGLGPPPTTARLATLVGLVGRHERFGREREASTGRVDEGLRLRDQGLALVFGCLRISSALGGRGRHRLDELMRVWCSFGFGCLVVWLCRQTESCESRDFCFVA